MNKISKIFIKPFSALSAERFIFYLLILTPTLLYSHIDKNDKQILRIQKRIAQNTSYLNSNETQLKEFLENNIQTENLDWLSLGPNQLGSSQFLTRKGLGRFNFIKVHPFKENEFWAGTPSGKLYKSTNYCNSWEVVNTSIISTGYYDVGFSNDNPNLIYAVTGDYVAGTRINSRSLNLIISEDSGDSWKELPVNGLSELSLGRIWVDPKDDQRIVITAFEGLLLSRDGGQNFELSLEGLPFRDIEHTTSKEDALYASSYDYESNGYIYKSTDRGESWQEMVLFTNGGNIELAISQQDSSIWALVANSNTQKMLGLFRNNDLGVNWRSQDVPYDLVEGQGFYNLALAISNEGDIAAGGINLNLKSNDSWKKNGIIHVDQHYAFYLKDTLYIANDGGLFKSFNSKWEFISNGIANTEFYELEFKYDNYQIALGGSQDNGVQRLIYDNWDNVLGGDGFVNIFDPNNSSKVYSSLQFGKIFSSDNYGEVYNKDLSIQVESNFYTKFFIDPFTSELYSGKDELLLYRNDSWNNISDLTSDITDMKFFEDSILIATQEKLLIYNRSNQTINELFNSEVEILKSCKFEGENYLLLDRDSLRVFNLDQNNFLDSNLEYTHINDLVFHDDGTLYIATDIGVFKKNSSWIYLPFPLIQNAVCTDIDYSKKFDQLFVSTFGNGMWRLNLSSCPEEKIELSEKGEIQICENEGLDLFVNEFQADSIVWSNYTNENPLKVNKEDYYYANIYTSNCVFVSELLKVEIEEVEVEDISIAYIGKDEPCQGDTIILNIISPIETNRDSRRWSDGSNGEFIYVTQSGEYYWSNNSNGSCELYSDTINIEFKAIDTIPSIRRELDKIYSTNAENYDWYLDGELIKENSGFVTLTKSGVYKAAYNNSNSCIGFSQEFVVGSKNFEINILDNGRSFDSFIIEISSEDFSQVVIEIFDVSGRKIKEVTRNVNSNYLVESIRLGDISTGLYFLRVRVDNKTQTKKVVIN